MLRRILHIFQDIWNVYLAEVRHIFGDGGVLLFFVATLLYPLIFSVVYHSEMVRDIPVAVVDESCSADSRRFIHKVDATPEMQVSFKCCSMAEAERLMRQHEVRGIFYFPRDYATRIATGQTGRLCLFCDMSSFLYYRSVYSGASAVLLDEMKSIEIDRCTLSGMSSYEAEGQVTPIAYDDVKLFCAPGGFTSFLVPALLVLVVHQTLFLGIGVLFGTSQEKKNRMLIPEHLRRNSMVRLTLGKAVAYLLLYIPLIFINLFVLPRLFGLPHIGHISDLIWFLFPFLLATIFFSLTVASFFRERDGVILVCIVFSIVLLFVSGTVWPQCNMPAFWRYFGYLFPSTHGVQGFIRINSMGATLREVHFEYHMLWSQVIFYFFTTCLAFRIVEYRRKLKRDKIVARSMRKMPEK